MTCCYEIQGLREAVQGQLLQEFLLFVLDITWFRTVTSFTSVLYWLNLTTFEVFEL